jgi:superfamily II DNA/RNA helicase
MQVRFVVLDEADQMLDMGFQEDMEVILQQVRTGTRPAPKPWLRQWVASQQ